MGDVASTSLAARAGTAMVGAIFLNWTTFLVPLLFSVLLASGAGSVFELFAGFGLISFVLTAKWLPEISGRSLEMIELEQFSEDKNDF